MTIDWDAYEVYDPGVDRPLHEVSRAEARAAFDKLMYAKDHRIEQLKALLARNGVSLDSTNEGIQALNDWFRSNVAGDPRQDGRLEPEWYSVVNDISLFLGEVIISRAPHLHWTMLTRPKSDVSFQRHVIVGFQSVDNPQYNIDPDFAVAVHGHRVVCGDPVSNDEFVGMVEDAIQDACFMLIVRNPAQTCRMCRSFVGVDSPRLPWCPASTSS